MKSSIFSVALLVLLVLNSCKKENEFLCTDSETRSIIYLNRGLNQIKDSTMIDSSLFVRSYFYETFDETSLFQHEFVHAHCSGINHSRKVDVFKMAIPIDSTNSFSYYDEDIKMISAYSSKAYNGGDFLQHFIESGSIVGNKIDDKIWDVQIDVITKPQHDALTSEMVEINTTFKVN